MTSYRYIGRNINGERVEGILRADNPEDLENRLAERAVFLDSYHLHRTILFQTLTAILKKSEITRLTRQTEVLISSGIPAVETLESVREQIDDRYLGSVYDRIIAAVQSGQPIHRAFGQFPVLFDDLYQSLLEAGEISGTIAMSLNRIAAYREKAEAVAQKIRAALAYPALVLAVSIIVIFVLIIYIIPIFASMYANFGLELPVLTRRIVAFSEGLQNYIGYLAGFVVILLVGLPVISQTRRFKVFSGLMLLKIPVIKSLSVKLATARFCRTLGTLLISGLQLMNAVTIAGKTVGNKYLENRLRGLPGQLARGLSLAPVLSECGVFPKTVIRMTAAGEATGRLGEMFAKAADFYESETDTEITAMTSVIEPLIIFILGLAVAFILIAMYLPLFDLIGRMGA